MKYRVSGGSRGERWGEEPLLHVNVNAEGPGNEYVNKPSKQHTREVSQAWRNCVFAPEAGLGTSL